MNSKEKEEKGEYEPDKDAEKRIIEKKEKPEKKKNREEKK